MQLFLAGEYSEDAKRLCVSEKTVRAQAPILWRDGSGDARGIPNRERLLRSPVLPSRPSKASPPRKTSLLCT